MPLQNFVDNSVPAISADWLNSVDAAVLQAIGDGASPPSSSAEVLQNLGFTPSTGSSLVGHASDGTGAATMMVGEALDFGGVTPSMFGAVGDGSTDDTTELQNWLASVFPKRGEPKTFKVTGTLTLPDEPIDFCGMIIDGSAGETWTSNSVVYSAGEITQISALSASPSKGGRSLSFSTTHGMAAGDVGIIYNPTNNSWGESYTYSRAGEFFRVAYVSSTTAAKLDNPLHAGYTAGDVDVYVMAKKEVVISNLEVIAPASGNIRPLRIRMATKINLRNVSCSGSDAIEIDLDRCYSVRIDGACVDNRGQSASATYGLSIGNCQHVYVNGSQINATRHAVNIGGDDFPGAVVNRDITIEGNTLRSDSALSSVPCADIHENCEGVVYKGNRIYGGGSIGGKDCSYIDNTFEECAVSVGAMLQGGSQWYGGYAKIIGNTFMASGAYANGLIRMFIDATNAKTDSHLIVRDNVVSMGVCDVFCRVDNNNTTYKGNAHVSGVTFLDSASLSNVLRMSGVGTGDYAVVDDIRNGKSGASLFVEADGYVVTSVALQEQSGTAAITPVSAASSASTSVTFRYSYGSRTPVMSLVLDQDAVNSITPVGRVGSVSATGFGAYIKSADGTNFGATTPVVNGHWTARVSQI